MSQAVAEFKLQSFAQYPQSKGRSETAVKIAKRIFETNINPVAGQLNTKAAGIGDE